MRQTIIAVDLAKSVFEVSVSEKPGRITDLTDPGRLFTSETNRAM
jgi:hypothetical protein